jgi:hypothetical protein
MLYRHDPNLYTAIPTRTAAGTMSLTRALIVAAPEQPSDPVKKRLANMYSKAVALQTAWNDANRPDSNDSARGADLTLDRCWSAIRSRVQDWVNVGDPDHAERAGELIELLFPTGLRKPRVPDNPNALSISARRCMENCRIAPHRGENDLEVQIHRQAVGHNESHD